MNYDEFVKTKFMYEGNICYGSTIIDKIWLRFTDYVEEKDDIAEAAVYTANETYIYHVEEKAMPEITFDHIKNVYRQCYGEGHTYDCDDIDKVIKNMSENITCYKIKNVVHYVIIADMLLQEVNRLIKVQQRRTHGVLSN
jgi:hypothetical protein